jgi:hypothetical protein
MILQSELHNGGKKPKKKKKKKKISNTVGALAKKVVE